MLGTLLGEDLQRGVKRGRHSNARSDSVLVGYRKKARATPACEYLLCGELEYEEVLNAATFLVDALKLVLNVLMDLPNTTSDGQVYAQFREKLLAIEHTLQQNTTANIHNLQTQRYTERLRMTTMHEIASTIYTILTFCCEDKERLQSLIQLGLDEPLYECKNYFVEFMMEFVPQVHA